jgi:hypothetical protein
VSYKIVEVVRDPLPVPAAAPLARKQGEAVIAFLRESIRGGFSPIDGEDRERKGDGKPRGYDTGRLADGLRLRSAGSTRYSAKFEIAPPSDRAMLSEPGEDGLSFIDRHELISVEGRAAELIDEATEIYMLELAEK